MPKRTYIIAGLTLLLILAGIYAYRYFRPTPEQAVQNLDDKNDNMASAPKVDSYTAFATVKSIQGTDLQVSIAAIKTDSHGLGSAIEQSKTVHTTADTKYFIVNKTGSRSAAKFSNLKVGQLVYITTISDLTRGDSSQAIQIEVNP